MTGPGDPSSAAAAAPARATTRAGSRRGWRHVLRTPLTYLELTKPGITRLVTLTAGVGFFMGSAAGAFDWWRLLHTLVGVALAASGANALNQWMERGPDALMRRTRSRPLPTGRITPMAALVFASALALSGVAYLLFTVNAGSAALVAASIASYVLVYTPMKTRTSLCTLAGAVPGALPIMAGWVGSGAALGLRAWSLFWIMFLWQIPHFLALAWLYREDYARGGYVMLSVQDAEGRATGRQILLYGVALLPMTLVPTMLGLADGLYFYGALGFGLIFLALGVAMTVRPTARRARRLFLASVLYLPLLFTLMVVDKV